MSDDRYSRHPRHATPPSVLCCGGTPALWAGPKGVHPAIVLRMDSRPLPAAAAADGAPGPRAERANLVACTLDRDWMITRCHGDVAAWKHVH